MLLYHAAVCMSVYYVCSVQKVPAGSGVLSVTAMTTTTRCLPQPTAPRTAQQRGVVHCAGDVDLKVIVVYPRSAPGVLYFIYFYIL